MRTEIKKGSPYSNQTAVRTHGKGRSDDAKDARRGVCIVQHRYKEGQKQHVRQQGEARDARTVRWVTRPAESSGTSSKRRAMSHGAIVEADRGSESRDR